MRGLPVKQYIIFFTNNEWIITPLLIATFDKCSNLNHFTVSYLNLENANCKTDLHEINITNHIYAIRSYRYYPRYYLIKIKNANNQAKRLILNSTTISKGFMPLCAKRKSTILYKMLQSINILQVTTETSFLRHLLSKTQ